MDRVFLDANVLFSAAYRSDAGLLALWRLLPFAFERGLRGEDLLGEVFRRVGLG